MDKCARRFTHDAYDAWEAAQAYPFLRHITLSQFSEAIECSWHGAEVWERDFPVRFSGDIKPENMRAVLIQNESDRAVYEKACTAKYAHLKIVEARSYAATCCKVINADGEEIIHGRKEESRYLLCLVAHESFDTIIEHAIWLYGAGCECGHVERLDIKRWDLDRVQKKDWGNRAGGWVIPPLKYPIVTYFKGDETVRRELLCRPCKAKALWQRRKALRQEREEAKAKKALKAELKAKLKALPPYRRNKVRELIRADDTPDMIKRLIELADVENFAAKIIAKAKEITG